MHKILKIKALSYFEIIYMKSSVIVKIYLILTINLVINKSKEDNPLNIIQLYIFK